MDVLKVRNPRYVGILALVACLILVGGWLARPRDLPPESAPIPSETELELLARRSERRSLDSMANYFGRLARDVEPSVAPVRSGTGSGIVWDEQRIVTTPTERGQSAPAESAASGLGQGDPEPTIRGPNLPLAAVPIDPNSELIPAQRAASLPQSGQWLVAVWRSPTSPAFAVGNFHQKTSITCGATPVDEVVSSLGLAEPMAGGGVFDIDGGLVAIILPCNGRLVAIAAEAIDGILAKADTIEQRVLSGYGLALRPLSAEEAGHFKTSDGLLVREVWTGYAGDEAGLRPGDVLLAVNGLDLRTVEDLRAMTTPSTARVELTLLRGSKRMKKALSASGVQAAAGDEAPDAGLVLEAPRPVYRIPSIRPGSAAARAGLEAGDRVIRIDQAEPQNLDQINREFRGDKRPPIWIEVERGARRLGMLVR